MHETKKNSSLKTKKTALTLDEQNVELARIKTKKTLPTRLVFELKRFIEPIKKGDRLFLKLAKVSRMTSY